MNILFVDDDIDTLEALQQTINFSRLGFQNVYMLTSAKAAMALIREKPIDILVTDIEMPENSGIDLLQWVNQQENPILTIFCTCFANFDYAQKAIELHAFDYYLKPISSKEFTRHLQKAIAEVEKQRKKDNTLNKSFWESLLIVGSASTDEALAYNKNDTCCICLSYLLPEDIPPQKNTLHYVHECEQDLLRLKTFRHEAVLNLFKNINCNVFLLHSADALIFEEALHSICRQCKEQKIAIVYYYKILSYSDCCRETFTELLQYAVDDVERKSPVVNLDFSSSDNIRCYERPDLYELSKSIESQTPETSRLLLRRQLKTLSSNHVLNHNNLKAYILDVVQITYHILNKYQISAHTLYSTPEFEELEPYAKQFVKYACLYLEKIIDTANDALSKATRGESLAEIITHYINEHLSEPLSRTSLANHVFLNPDYLARQFKRETGVSLSAYISTARIDKAKTLLLSTNKPISEISASVGYDNSSYFSQIFLQKTGETPAAFRKKYRNAHS